MHDVEAIHDLRKLLTRSGNLFSNITVSRASLIFLKDFQMLIAVKKGEIVASTSCTRSHNYINKKARNSNFTNTNNLTIKTIVCCSPCKEDLLMTI